jgi:NADH-quinone oxidoreductase subunit G
VARIKPRLNPEVNGYWICDEGRYGFENLNQDRLGRVMRLKDPRGELGWSEMFDELSTQIKDGISRKGAEGLAVIASGSLSNEDWSAFKDLFVGTLKVQRFLFGPQPDQLGEEDDLLRRRDKVPNLKGGAALGFGTEIQSTPWEELASDIKSGKVWGLYIIERDLKKIWKTETAQLLSHLDLIVFQGPNKGETGSLAHYRLPSTAYVEENGHFTNFEGKVQAYTKALEPLGSARPDWRIFNGLKEAWSKTQSAAAGLRK